MSESLKKPFWQIDYAESAPGSVLLDTVTNPVTGLVYDIWMVRVGSSYRWSATCHHGPNEWDYGSFPAMILKDRILPEDECDNRDWLFGLWHARNLGIKFLEERGEADLMT